MFDNQKFMYFEKFFLLIFNTFCFYLNTKLIVFQLFNSIISKYNVNFNNSYFLFFGELRKIMILIALLFECFDFWGALKIIKFYFFGKLEIFETIVHLIIFSNRIFTQLLKMFRISQVNFLQNKRNF